MKDVTKTNPQNINPLTTKDLKKILYHSIEQVRLCENIVLVSVEEYQKALFDTKVQPSIQKTNNTPIKVDTQVKEGQIDQNKEDAQDTRKEEEQQLVQTLVNLPSANTPTKSLQELSTTTVPLQMSTQGSSTSKVAKVTHYGENFLDEEIVIPHCDFATMTLEDII